jgi:hypothetical protein
MSDTAETAKPVVFQTTEQVEKQDLGAMAKNLDDALQKPRQTKAEDLQSEFDKQALHEEVQKQAEEYEPPSPVENPVDKDHPLRHFIPFLNKRVGDVGASEVFKEKVKYVDLKGGQKAA